MKAIEISKKINALLIANTELKAKVGENIFPLIAEAQTPFPFVVFKRNNITPIYTKDWMTEQEVNVEVVVASNKYFESVEIAVIIRDILEGYADNDIKQVKVESITENFIEDCYTQRLTFNIIL